MRPIYVLIIAGIIQITGCTTITEAGYYWGDYSNTLYRYTKEPSEETLAAHVEELNKIISVSEEKGLRVPPGIYAELGYIDARSGGNAKAKAYYESEMLSYPESRPFLERLIAINDKAS